MKTPEDRADVSVVFVHGIGNQKRGSIVRRWGESCIFAMEQMLRVERHVKLKTPAATQGEDRPLSYVLSLTQKRKTRKLEFIEANWSTSFARASPLVTTMWLLKMLPALLLLFAFDVRDAKGLSSNSDEGDSQSQSVFAKLLFPRGVTLWSDEHGVMLRLIWRLITALLILVCLTSAAKEFGLSAGALAILLLFVLGTKRFNLAGHVRHAVLQDKSYADIVSQVGSVVRLALIKSDRLIIVGHSQGGMIALDVIRAMQPNDVDRVELITVGSGVRPIALLRHFSEGHRLLFAWFVMVLFAVPVIAITCLVDIRLPDTMRSQMLLQIRMVLMSALDISFLSYSPVKTSIWQIVKDSLPLAGISLKVSPWWIAVYFLAVIGVVLWLRPKMTEHDLDVTIPAIQRLRWDDVTSPHDVVGRLLWPSLPQKVLTRRVTLGGNPVWDHTAYMARFSLVPYLVSARIFERLGIRKFDAAISLLEEHLSNASVRRRRFRLYLVGTWVLLALWFWIVIKDLSIGSAFVRIAPTAGVLLIGSGLCVMYRERYC